MNDDEDLDTWLNALAGRTEDKDVPEATMVRSTILREDLEIQAKIDRSAASDKNATQRLLFRLRRERVLHEPFFSRLRLPLAIAASLIVAVLVSFQFQGDKDTDSNVAYDEPPVFRGGSSNDIVLKAPAPAKVARALVAELGQAGLTATIYRDSDGYYVDFDLPQEQSIVVGQRYFPGGIKPRVGHNRIIITK